MRTRRPKSRTATRTRARWTALWATGRTGLRAARSAGADRRRAVVRWRWTLRTEATSAGVRTRLCRVTSSRVQRRSPQQHLRQHPLQDPRQLRQQRLQQRPQKHRLLHRLLHRQLHRQLLQRSPLLQRRRRYRRSLRSIASWATGPPSRVARRSVAEGTCRDIERLNRSSTVGGHAMRTRRPKSRTATRTRARWTALWATGRTGLRAARSAGADRRRAVVRWRWTLRTEATSAGVRTRLCRVTSSRVRRQSPQQHLRQHLQQYPRQLRQQRRQKLLRKSSSTITHTMRNLTTTITITTSRQLRPITLRSQRRKRLICTTSFQRKRHLKMRWRMRGSQQLHLLERRWSTRTFQQLRRQKLLRKSSSTIPQTMRNLTTTIAIT